MGVGLALNSWQMRSSHHCAAVDLGWSGIGPATSGLLASGAAMPEGTGSWAPLAFDWVISPGGAPLSVTMVDPYG